MVEGKSGGEELSDEADTDRKIKRAMQLLLLSRPRSPGVKGWELRKSLGKNFLEIIKILQRNLDQLDLEVKIIFEEGGGPKNPTEEQFDRARFFVLSKGRLHSSDIPSTGWRIDDVAMLAATLGYVIAHQGKTPRRDLEVMLREKFPKWRVNMNIDRFVRRGYLLEDKEGMLAVGWRSRAEVDEKTLLSLILASGKAISQSPG